MVDQLEAGLQINSKSVVTPIDEGLSEIRSLRNDIWRCRKLLQTGLSDAEREIVEQRLRQQYSAFEGLLATTFPFTLRIRGECGEARGLPAVDHPIEQAETLHRD